MVKAKKANQAGAAVSFMSRSKAMRKLQLTLKDFRRLCILKGIYPREPLHRKKALKGSTDNRVLYSVKDIKYLANEPMIEKFRKDKIFLRKIKTARRKKEPERAEKLLENRPDMNLDSIVKEHLDDCLCLCAAFAVLPRSRIVRRQTIDACRRLLAEFMHYVIESHSLTKVFVSIKGIYYQASIMGEKVTWLVGHERSVGKLGDIDLPVMTTFVQFYTTTLKFVNFRLYKSLGLHYPPRLADADENKVDDEEEEVLSERVCSLAKPLSRAKNVEPEVTIDTFDAEESGEKLAERIREAEALRTLFSKSYFFLNREVSKEPLALVIRNCGGFVSWDGCPQQPFGEDSPLITHHIMDRPLTKVDVKRKFLQPQWVFDSFNARRLLPIDFYKPGSKLPAHLSPFVEERYGEYIPMERVEQLKADGKDISHLLAEPIEQPKKQQKKPEVVRAENKSTGVKVKEGQAHKVNQQHTRNEEAHQLKLKEMLIPKRHRRPYKKIKFGEKRQQKEVRKMIEKRKKISQNDGPKEEA
ncbi:Pescadillo-like protein [Aphelenchoides bicaudatus]|nr:Pescadillo-like protein [Aphelenchoides bicaudatus]